MMTLQAIYPARSISPLQTSRYDRRVRASFGAVHIVMDEKIVVLGEGQETMIPRGTMYALANLSDMTAAVSGVAAPGMQDADSTVFAEASGAVYGTHRSCLMQVTLSLYQNLQDSIHDHKAVAFRQAA